MQTDAKHTICIQNLNKNLSLAIVLQEQTVCQENGNENCQYNVKYNETPVTRLLLREHPAHVGWYILNSLSNGCDSQVLRVS